MPMRPWTEAELATLAELAETFVRGGAVRRAGLAADALSAAADPAQVGQLRLVLRLMESRRGEPRAHRQAARFRDLSPVARERYLLGWGALVARAPAVGVHGVPHAADVPRLRRPRDLGRGQPAAGRDRLRPDDPPVTAQLDRRSSATELPPPTGDETVLEADVVVVGSGAGGGVVAAALARAGRSVVVLEAGPFVDEAPMPRDELDAFDRLYLNHGLLTTWDGSVTMLAGGGGRRRDDSSTG